MSSRSDRCSPSDDELPQLKNLLQLGTQKTKSTTKLATNLTDQKNAVIKTTSISVSSSRKVRRLGGGKLPTINPLFLPLSRRMKDDLNVSSASVSNELARKSHLEPRKAQTCPSIRQFPALSSTGTVDPLFPCPLRRKFSNHEKEALTSKPQDSAAATRQVTNFLAHNGQSDEGMLQKKTRQQRQLIEADAGAQKWTLDSEEERSTVYETAPEDTSGESDSSLWGPGPDTSSDDLLEEFEPKMPQPRGKSFTGQLGSEDMCPRVSHRSLRHDVKESIRASKVSVETVPTHARHSECLSQFGDSSDDETPPPKQCINLQSSESPWRESRSRNFVSPRKLALIPATPDRPSVDTFWSQDFVDDWNDHHSPQKPFLPATFANPVKLTSSAASPVKRSPAKTVKKKLFDAEKRSLTEAFFRELDSEITQGKIAELAESTGGVKLVWTKSLNTTAGRANWKRETTRTRLASGETTNVTHKHHASIELAEKVIDDENKLLNVLAHEFCHLANFMISGVTKNPHGKEFKVWAAKCSRAFGDSRGIRVTTKHTYEIAFKFVWGCPACGYEYKRHSKSIDPRRHRCGCCKGVLVQIRPVPKKTGSAASGSKLTEYQTFVKEQMMAIRKEAPSILQKEVMKTVAKRWSKHKKGLATADAVGKPGVVDGVVHQMTHITLED